MSWGSALRSALGALAANALRSFLTMLGIIIGVAAVIAMVAVGRGATERVQTQMKGLGSNIMLVLPGGVSQAGVRLGAQTRQRLTEEDALAIGLEIPEVQVAAPTSRATGQVVWGNSNWGTTVMGVNNEYLEARDWPLRSGRVFDTAELAGSAKVVWLGATVARELFGDQDPVEQTVRLRGIPMTVVGVLSSKGQNSMGQDQDDVVMLPLGTLRNRVWGGDATSRLKRVGAISVKVREGQDMGGVEERIKELLRQRFKVQPGAEDPFSVRNLTEMLRAQEESSRVMTLLLATVAGISLVIGGIGIMNIMLVSVTERTREIGLRMAVGARGRDILAQFLIEAITLSLVGGALGVVLGAAATWLIGTLAGWQWRREQELPRPVAGRAAREGSLTQRRQVRVETGAVGRGVGEAEELGRACPVGDVRIGTPRNSRSSQLLVCGEKRVGESRVHPRQQIGIVGPIPDLGTARYVRISRPHSRHTLVDAIHPPRLVASLVGCPEGGDGQPSGRAPQPPDWVVAKGRVAVDSVDGYRVQRLQQERTDSADERRQTGVHGPRGPVDLEQRLRRAAGQVGDPLGTALGIAGEKAPERGTHSRRR